jgi:hypothetical protein
MSHKTLHFKMIADHGAVPSEGRISGCLLVSS